jgi:hypothetical protein
MAKRKNVRLYSSGGNDMKQVKEELRLAVVEELRKKADDWNLAELEPGKDSVVATALVTGLRSDRFEPPKLVIRQRNGFLGVEVRGVTRLGNTGHIGNRTVANLLRCLFFKEMEEGDGKADDQIMMLQILTHQYLTSPRDSEDLLAAAIEGSNDVTVFTRAVKDARDGEVYVTAVVEFDGETFPATFLDIVEGVVVHAARIGRFVRMMRDLVLPEATPMRDVVAKILASNAKKNETEEAPVAELTL